MAKVKFSAGSKQDLEKMINQYFYSENYFINDNLEIKNKKSEYKGDLKIRVKNERHRKNNIRI